MSKVEIKRGPPLLGRHLPTGYAEKLGVAYRRALPKVQKQAAEKGNPDPLEEGGGCLFWTGFAALELDKLGIKTQVQAGSMMWQIVPQEELPKLPENHPLNFGYQFGIPSEASIAAIRDGSLPEMHVWLADVDNGVIIDFSTGGIRGALLATAPEFKWLQPPPPTFLAVTEKDKDAGDHAVWYTPDPMAWVVALCYLFHFFKGKDRPWCLTTVEEVEPKVNKAPLAYANWMMEEMRSVPVEERLRRAKEVFYTKRN